MDKYKGKSAQISNYGKWNIDVLFNELAKVCGLITTGQDIPGDQKEANKKVIAQIKKHCKMFIDTQMEQIDEQWWKDNKIQNWNEEYDNICEHFTRLYGKVKYFGTHAAGVAIVGTNILDYAAVRTAKDGKKYIVYDLEDAQQAKIMKFDVLGLKTMESLAEMRKATGEGLPDYRAILDDDEVWEAFHECRTEAIFQFESQVAKSVLETIIPDNFGDLAASTALDRPGPLGLKMHEQYKENKDNWNDEDREENAYDKYLKDTYGTIVYQEQIQSLVTEIGGLSWEDADRVIKMGTGGSEVAMSKKYKDYLLGFRKQFVKNSVKLGIDKDEAYRVYTDFFNYSFNKGHATGYTLISIEEMFYKVHYPEIFWYVKIRDSMGMDDKVEKNIFYAVKDGVIVFLPHVNYSAHTTLRKVEGEYVVQLGLDYIKFVGGKAADAIEEERKENGVFKSYDEFVERCKSRAVTTRVIDALEDIALQFDKKAYHRRVTKFNAAMYGRSGNFGVSKRELAGREGNRRKRARA